MRIKKIKARGARRKRDMRYAIRGAKEPNRPRLSRAAEKVVALPA